MEENFRSLRMEMVERQIRHRGVRDERVLRAMEIVPRHLFVPSDETFRAYDDSALAIGFGQTISQPYIVGLMTELLEVLPEHRILEIGTGSGYQTVILSMLAAEVFTIDIKVPLVDLARRRLSDQRVTNVRFDVRDGYSGWPEAAPFDRIMVTAGARWIPDKLIEQLVTEGRMVIPVGLSGEDQILKVVVKAETGGFRVRDIGPVRFVPLLPDSIGDQECQE
jgi:protein-L-isoaspartate(D-aspartate) O-methyltransferase